MKKAEDKEYTCEYCGNTYLKNRTDEEAIKESELLWGPLNESERVVICEDCYNLAMQQVPERLIMGTKH